MNDTLDIQALTSAARAGQPEAQWRLGALCFSRGEITASLEWLGKAAENHVADAQNLLGIIYLNGIGTVCQPRAAASLFTAAAEHDLKEAHFNLSGLLFSGSIAPTDESAALRHLLRAAELGHRAAWRVLGYLYALETAAASRERATQCFARAAIQGDAHAEYMLGLCYLRDQGTAAGNEAARYWLAQAADKHIYCAAAQLKALRDRPPAGQRPRSAQECVEDAKRLADRSLNLVVPDINAAARGKPLTAVGMVAEAANVIDGNLCDYLVNLVAARMQPSGVVDPATGMPLQSELRTSSSTNYQLSMYDMAVGMACRKLAGLTGMDLAHAEPLSVLRYLPGQEYKLHYDHFAVDEHGAPRVRDANGQRLVTVFVYLNDVEAGGETDFPRVGVRVRPAKGKAVAFLNCDAAGQPNSGMLHAGMPVIRGEKWLATLWFRERAFNWE